MKPFLINNIEVSYEKDREIVEQPNKYSVEIALTANHRPAAQGPVGGDLVRGEGKCLTEVMITEDNVFELLRPFDCKKRAGPDLIHPRALKESAQFLYKSLTVLINRSPKEGKFPTCLLDAHVTLLPKKSDATKSADYRPIYTVSTLSKILEKCLGKHVRTHMIKKKLSNPLQPASQKIRIPRLQY